MVIVVGGMIGAGKTTVAELIANDLGSELMYEPVDGNEILEKFYTASKEEEEKYRYPFILQLYFLGERFKLIKKAFGNDNNVMDRSIYEDWYFAKINHELSRISDLEFSIYENLLNNMLEEVEQLPKKSPDLMVYLRCSFDTILDRISLRGREFENDAQKDYFYKLWSGYDDWVQNWYNASDVLIIDMDEVDVVNNKQDAENVLNDVKKLLKQNSTK